MRFLLEMVNVSNVHDPDLPSVTGDRKKSSHFQSCSVGALLIGNYHKPATFAGISVAEMCLLPPPHNVTFKTAAHDGRITGSLSSHGS